MPTDNLACNVRADSKEHNVSPNFYCGMVEEGAQEGTRCVGTMLWAINKGHRGELVEKGLG
jgi:hypothetical protein